MMIDFALDAQRNQGKNPAEAIYDGCLIRVRPTMMTTMAALMGTLPIALGFGAGAEARRPLGLTVCGGWSAFFAAHHPLYHSCDLYLSGGSPDEGEEVEIEIRERLGDEEIRRRMNNEL
jgi:hypothetical protein